MNSEQQLIMRCRNRDKSAFEELVRPYLQRAYSTSLGILKSQDLAEDAVQNALIEVYTSILKGKEIRNFKTWFNHLVACRALDIARQRVKQNQSLSNIEDYEIADDSSSPIESIVKKEQGNEMFLKLMNLDFIHRTVVILYYYQELTIEEIAEILQIKKGTVKSRLNTARVRLAQLVQSDPFREKVIEC